MWDNFILLHTIQSNYQVRRVYDIIKFIAHVIYLVPFNLQLYKNF
jgi:hypothetical protein